MEVFLRLRFSIRISAAVYTQGERVALHVILTSICTWLYVYTHTSFADTGDRGRYSVSFSPSRNTCDTQPEKDQLIPSCPLVLNADKDGCVRCLVSVRVCDE